MCTDTPCSAPPIGEFHTCNRCHKLYHQSVMRRYRVPGRLHDFYWVCHPRCPSGKGSTGQAKIESSPLELEVLKALGRTIYSWEQEVQIGPWKVDFYIRELNMIIEADGAKYHDGKRRAHDHAKRDFLQRAGYHVVVVTASETAAQVDAAVLARQRALSAERLEYAERLAAARAAIEKDPSMALPRPKNFRFKQGDFRELRRLQARLREPELARQRELTRRCIAARKTEPSWFIEALAGVQQQPNDPLPPRENFTEDQYAQLTVAQRRALAAAWAKANPKRLDAPRHTLENRRDKQGRLVPSYRP